MFLNFIKNFNAKRLLKKSNNDVLKTHFSNSIQTVGLIIDETQFTKKAQLIESIINKGVLQSNLKILLYKNKFKKDETINFPFFSKKDLSWLGKIKKIDANNFIEKEFDLLISFYEDSKLPLLVTTHQSNAKFKVGFSSIDYKINDLMIDTNLENNVVFIEEVFKYLKILNKI